MGLAYADVEYIYQSSAANPLQKVYSIGGWVPRVPTELTPSYISIHIADNYIVPDATLVPYNTPNNAAAVIEPDSLNYYELEPLTRPDYGGKVYAYNANRNGEATQSIKGEGTWGAHFGSGLSTLGGSIRSGEINGPEPIRHAIKLEFDTHVFLKKNSADAAQSYRWPAYNCDGNTSSYGIYNTNNKAQTVGALLAIPPLIKMESLNLKTAQAKKIFQTLQDYGAYIDASGDGYKPNGGYSVTVCAEKKVVDTEFSFQGSTDVNLNWFNDFKALLKSLKIVDNNSPTTIGGGGTPTKPLAPDFIN